MQAEMKCPTCGGDKFKFMGDNTFKCAYCGATLVNEPQVKEVPVEQPKQVEVITRVEYVPQQQNQNTDDEEGVSIGVVLIAILLPLFSVLIMFSLIG